MRLFRVADEVFNPDGELIQPRFETLGFLELGKDFYSAVSQGSQYVIVDKLPPAVLNFLVSLKKCNWCAACLKVGEGSMLRTLTGSNSAPVEQGSGDPTLYKRTAALKAVTRGNNGNFAAASGWDACLGLGSPNGKKIAEIVQPRHRGLVAPL